MNDFSSEQKLRLVHAIREEHKNNQLSMRNRERILMGENIQIPEQETNFDKIGNEPSTVNISSFRIRFFIAMILFICFIFMDIQNIDMNGVNAAKIQSSITEDFQSNIFDFMDTIPYTLESIQDEK